MSASARAPRWRASFAALLPDDGPDPFTAWGRLIAVNALLLARSLHGPANEARPRLVIPYERHVADRAATLSGLARFLDVPVPALEAPQPDQGQEAADATFATTGHKDRLTARLSPGDAAGVSESVAATFEAALQTLGPHVTGTTREWVAGDDLYELQPPVARASRFRRRPPLPWCPGPTMRRRPGFGGATCWSPTRG
ncbi:hypothetical protein [Streptomyces sasae]|uniref:hypothetical protein n=1 Tax=Streptomyces sasae TaxID=1266772 RepID=UPI002930223C|nr:hypothetical protein [Streptomyces sasae]